MDRKQISELIRKCHKETSADIVSIGFGHKVRGDVVTDEESIVFSVEKKKPIEELKPNELIPKTVSHSGITLSTDVIEMKRPVFLTSCPNSFYEWQQTPPSNRNKIRPLKGGVAVTNHTDSGGLWVGTLGFLAVDNETNSLVGVSNRHVLVESEGWLINSQRSPSAPISNIRADVVTQPNENLSDSIGVVKRYVPITLEDYNYADAALTTIDSTAVDNTISLQQEGLTGWTTALEFATSQEIDNLMTTNPKLFSSGRTTGAKGEGEMELRTHENFVSINMGGGIYFADCIMYIARTPSLPPGAICPWPVAGGDSGSALIAEFGGVRKIIGLVFAGGEASNGDGKMYYGVANRIDDVATSINISPWYGQSVSFSDKNNIEEHIVSGLSSDLTINISGKTFWQAGTV